MGRMTPPLHSLLGTVDPISQVFYVLEFEEPDQDAFKLSSPRTVNIG